VTSFVNAMTVAVSFAISAFVASGTATLGFTAMGRVFISGMFFLVAMLISFYIYERQVTLYKITQSS